MHVALRISHTDRDCHRHFLTGLKAISGTEIGLDEPLNKQSMGCGTIHNAVVLFVLFLIDHKLVRTSGMGHSRSYYVAAFLSLVESSFPFSSSG